MMPEFEKLENSEVELMLKAPILACILIAGADDHIDNREIRESIEMAKVKHKNFKSSPLAKFYLLVAEDFEDKLKIVLQSYPVKAAARNKIIVEELAGLNDVLPKLEKQFAIDFYTSIRDIAQRIAESSGGLLGIKSVGEEEARLVDLPMITPPRN
ncbi:MAG TPA: hypothetical protein PKJ63_10325 [Cyclobacteriaceae bacterium]|nr:hypothetical protein [Cyclobacteriaceae bacterium]